MKHLVFYLIAVLAGCANVSPTPFQGPNGKQAYSMRCSGMGRTMDACFQAAGEMCPGGYQIIDRASGTVAMPAYGGGIMAAPRESLVIECK